MRNRRLTSPQLAASSKSTCKTPVSTSTVKRRFRDAGLLGRVAKKKPYLRLANKKEKIKMGKRTQTLDRGRLEKGVMDIQIYVCCVWITKKNIRETPKKLKDAGVVLDTICQSWWRQCDVWGFFGGGKV